MLRISPIVCGMVLILTLAIIPAQAAEKKFVPKTADVDRTVLLAPVMKQFVVTRKTTETQLRQIAKISNATFVVDDGGGFPPKSLLILLGELDKPINLVLPAVFTDGHTRRLGVLGGDFDVTFRMTKETFGPEIAGRALAMGPRRKVFQISPTEVTKEILNSIGKVRVYELRLVVPDGVVLNTAQIQLLKKQKVVKEIVLPVDYPPERLVDFKSFKQLRLIFKVRGASPEMELIKAASGLEKIQFGAQLRGLVKAKEISSYTLIPNLRILRMHVEDWNVSDEFVELMNSAGKIPR